MCDTLFSAAEITKGNQTLFAKNSDRPPNEAQYLSWIPSRNYSKGETLQCTYITIPQVEKTASMLLSKPFWMWGAEMGVNEHGVAIGNESVFSKIPANKKPALLGMDLLRLGLERSKTSQEALDVIASLLEEHGQGGNCIQEGHLYYHNSFLISDPSETWVLETVDRHWAARKVSPIYSISNLISLETSWDRASSGLEDFLIDNGLTGSPDDIHLANDLSDLIYTTFGDGDNRCKRTRSMLEENLGEIEIQTMAAILREHNAHEDPTTGISGADICMHASLGPIRISQTTGSIIVSLQESQPVIFATGTAAPCTGIFKPVWIDAPLPIQETTPNQKYNPETLFWSHERLHRAVMENYSERLEVFKDERDALEEQFFEGALKLRGKSVKERRSYSLECFQLAAKKTEQWLEKIQEIPQRTPFLYSTAWKGFNKAAGFR
jgi:dipeptidase